MRRHLYYYTLVDGPPDAAAATLQGDPARWLPAPAVPLGDDTVRFGVDLSADGAVPHALARHRVIVEIGPPVTSDGRVLRSVMWRSATAPGLFPVFDGDLELAPLWGEGCQLSLMGTYRPPLSVAGRAGDVLLGHRIAEACVRRFVLDAAQRVPGATLRV